MALQASSEATAPTDHSHRYQPIDLFGLSGYKKWGMLFLLWTALAGVQTIRLFLAYNYKMDVIYAPVGQVAVWAMADWYFWGILSLVVVRVASRFEFSRRGWVISLGVHLVTAVILVLVHTFLYTIVYVPLGQLSDHLLNMTASSYGTGLWGRYQALTLNKWHTSFLIYFLIAFVSSSLIYQQRVRERETKLSQMEARLAEARLEALRQQLHPHFLFNTLNAITALIHTDPERADRMIARLSELLRISLDTVSAQEVSLKQELQFLNCYLDIQRMRFADRLTIETDVDPETLDCQVPNLILQPLVENAVKHGISPRAEGGTIQILAHKESHELILEIRDDGPGMTTPPVPKPTGGVGLTNTRERLQQLYGAQQRFEMFNGTGKGLVVRIAVPYRTESPVT